MQFTARIVKIGRSTGILIPQNLIKESGLQIGDMIDIEFKKLLPPKRKPSNRLLVG